MVTQDRPTGRIASIAAITVAVSSCEVLFGINDRTLAANAPDAGEDGSACVPSSGQGRPGAWPDSATAFCSDGVTAVDCSLGAKGQDGQYALDVPKYVPAMSMVAALQDVVTDLVWENGPAKVGTFDDAVAYCGGLGQGFRLPSIVELVSIVDYGRANPAAAQDFTVPGGTNGFYWSATPSGSGAWGVSFSEGIIQVADRTMTGRVRCVSGEPTGGCLEVLADGLTVTDRMTGLVWERAPDESVRTWIDALSRCEALELGGELDWRLPSIKELVTISFGEERSADAPAFPATALRFWSSTPSRLHPDKAFFMDFSTAWMGYDAIGTANGVRCVR